MGEGRMAFVSEARSTRPERESGLLGGRASAAGRLPDRATLSRGAYALGMGLVAAAIVLLLAEAAPSAEAAYAPMGAALVAGALLTIRLHPGQLGSGLVLLPALVAHARFGLAGLPATALALAVAELVQGAGAASALVGAGHAAVAFLIGHLAASAVPGGPLAASAAGFALGFAGSRTALWWLAARVGAPRPVPARGERPDLLLSLVLAPLAALPLVAWHWLEDGGLLLALAALLALLFVVREAGNLAVGADEPSLEQARPPAEELTPTPTPAPAPTLSLAPSPATPDAHRAPQRPRHRRPASRPSPPSRQTPPPRESGGNARGAAPSRGPFPSALDSQAGTPQKSSSHTPAAQASSWAALVRSSSS